METAPAPGRLRILDALRHADFRLLFTGQTLSQVGDAAFIVAIGWRGFTLTHRASTLAFLLTIEAACVVATLLVGGVLADRYSRRALLVVSDVARAAVVAVLAVVDGTGHLSFASLAVFVGLTGLGSGLFQPAFGGIVPLLVEPESLGSANALIGIVRQASLVVGPAIAGVVYHAGGSAAIFAVDAASFVASALLLLRARPRVFERGPSEGMRAELAAGLRYVASVPWLWVTIGLFSIVLMIGFAPFQVLVPKLVDEEWGLGVGAYGLLFALQGVGMVVGSVVLGQWGPRSRRGVLVYGLFAVNSAITIAFGLSPWFTLAAAITVARGFCIGFSITLWDTMLMERVPEHMLARVISMDWFGSLGLLPVGLALAGAYAGLASPGALIAIGSAACTALFLAGLATRAVRDVD